MLIWWEQNFLEVQLPRVGGIILSAINTDNNPEYQASHNDEVIERAQDILTAIQMTGNKGNTTKLMKLKDETTLIVASYDQADRLRLKHPDVLSFIELPQKLKGRVPKPLVFDNGAISTVVSELLTALINSQPYVRRGVPEPEVPHKFNRRAGD